MLINEQGLASALRSAYGRGGYTMQRLDDVLCIYTDSWFVKMLWKNIPRKALAAIVEHVGTGYVGAETLFVQKKLEPQLVMPDIANADLCKWLETDDEDGAETVEVTYVPLIVKGLQMFQTEQGAGKCYGVDPADLGIADGVTVMRTPGVVVDGNKILWRAEGEEVRVEAVRHTESYLAEDREKALWKALESVDLHTKK